MHENPELTGSEKALRNLSSALKDIAGAARLTIADDVSNDTLKASPMYELLLSAEPLEAHGYVADVLKYAERSLLSSCDHTLAFAQLIRTPAPPGPALVTVARGAVEAAARSWWLIQGGTLEELLQRILSMKFDDLKYSVRDPGSVVSMADGSDLNATEAQDFARDELTRLNLTYRPTISLSKMVSEMLSAVAPSPEVQRTYSLYSSIAHGQLHGINVFLGNHADGYSPALSIPVPFVNVISQQLLLVTNGVCTEFKHWIGGSEVDLSRLRASSARVSPILKSLPAEAFTPKE